MNSAFYPEYQQMQNVILYVPTPFSMLWTHIGSPAQAATDLSQNSTRQSEVRSVFAVGLNELERSMSSWK
jgi:hypothetical protein